MTNVYPLHSDTKEVAKMLVNAWEANQIEQYFELVYYSTLTSTNVSWGIGISNHNLPAPNVGSLKELNKYDLVELNESISGSGNKKFEITLLQELINAVERDFQFTKYRILQSPELLNEEIHRILANVLEENKELQKAIEELFKDIENVDERPRKFGAVIERLGNLM